MVRDVRRNYDSARDHGQVKEPGNGVANVTPVNRPGAGKRMIPADPPCPRGRSSS